MFLFTNERKIVWYIEYFPIKKFHYSIQIVNIQLDVILEKFYSTFHFHWEKKWEWIDQRKIVVFITISKMLQYSPGMLRFWLWYSFFFAQKKTLQFKELVYQFTNVNRIRIHVPSYLHIFTIFNNVSKLYVIQKMLLKLIEKLQSRQK